MYIGLLNDPEVTDDQLSTVTRCVSGGAALPVDVKQQFFKRFGLRIQEGYGLTETSPLACIQRPNETAKAGTIGKPVLGVDMKIFDDQDREVPQGERGRNRDPRPQHHEGLFQTARSDRRGDAERLVPFG